MQRRAGWTGSNPFWKHSPLKPNRTHSPEHNRIIWMGTKQSKRSKELPSSEVLAEGQEGASLEAGFGLNDLPPFLLEHILGYEGASFLLLWTCGDAALNAKMVKFITFARLRTVWALQAGIPPLLFKLRSLRTLELKSRGSMLPDPRDWLTVLESLPDTLETLRIESGDVFYFPLNLALWSPSLPIFIQKAYPMGASRFHDFSAWFPRLQTLGLNGLLFAQDLPGLPPSLTRFETDSFFNVLQGQLIMSILPRTLRFLITKVDAPATADQLEDWASPPPALEVIKSIIVPNPLEDYSWIPRTVNSVRIITRDGLPVKLSKSAAKTLPRLLTVAELDVDAITPEWPSAFPQSLISLDITIRDFLASDIALLPRTLHYLTLNLASSSFSEVLLTETEARAKNTSIWPPNLISLKLRSSPLPAQLFDIVPPTLRSLSTTIDGYSKPLVLSTLPPLLTRLTVTLHDCANLTFEGIPAGLTSLKSLSSKDGQPACISLPTNTLRSKLVKFFASFPADCCIGQPTDPFKHLRWLKADQCPFSVLALLPSTLTSLMIGTLTSLLNEANPLDLSPHLPTSLILLQIRCENAHPLDIASFARLTLLKHLNAPNGPGNTSKILRYLPRSLTRLQMPMVTLSDEDIPFLPPLLEEFDIKWIRGSNSQHQHLVAKYFPLGLSDALFDDTARKIIAKRRKQHGAH